ncbi:hypothetical protein AB0D46_06315 [Streptomyces sp. NPDC048383]|uniref:hypothetical protein n=1 Tax=Streptomyces sp. NPDC048383 TaxID=3155386 RepID=UPI00342381CE
MDEDGRLFARASLDGEVWRDALVHGETCPWCRDLGGAGPDGAGEGGGDMVGPGSGWMVAMCAVTVVAALLTVLS